MFSSQDLDSKNFSQNYLNESDAKKKHNLLVNEINSRLQDALADIKKVDAAVKGRESVENQTDKLNLSDCNTINLFDNDGSINQYIQKTKRIALQFQRIKGYFNDTFSEEVQYQLNLLSAQEKIIFDAVFFEIAFSLFSELSVAL